MATRSAHIVRPYVAFSMLQPVMIVPSTASRAAPTLNPENCARAFRRAFRAAAMSAVTAGSDGDTRDRLGRECSDTLDDPLEERDEGPSHAARRLHHLVMHQWLREHAGSHIGDTRNPEHLQSHVTRRNRFRNGGHSDRVRANRSEEPN